MERSFLPNCNNRPGLLLGLINILGVTIVGCPSVDS